MINPFGFIKYWYLRYILITELYMVEPWEKTIIHILCLTMFFSMGYFNYTIVLRTVSRFMGYSKIVSDEDMDAISAC